MFVAHATSPYQMFQVRSLVRDNLGHQRWEQTIEQNCEWLVAVEQADQVIACAAWGRAAFHWRTFWLGLCVVHPDHRLKGIADQLIVRRLAAIKANGGGTVLVSALHHDTNRFTKHGFSPISLQGDTHNLLITEV